MSREILATSDSWYFEPAKWPRYRRLIERAQERGIPFAMGGGFAQMAYTGWPRDAKDIDMFLMPEHRDAMIQITADEGFRDYFDEKPYDREWIYRSIDDEIIVDLIWAMANQRSNVDSEWVQRGPEIAVDGVRFRLLPVEELLWIKLYIMQRDRSDWPDALNLLYCRALDLDWRRLLGLLGDDRPLLTALMALFSWVCSDRVRELPRWLWDELGISAANVGAGSEVYRRRADLLDTRPWFVPVMQNKKGE